MEGLIFNIQRFSIYDGPGIRTNLFLQGCPLSCAWCHNPEGKPFRPVLRFDPAKCVGCGACASVCGRHILENGQHRIDRESCAGCGKCASLCRWEALELPAKRVKAEDAMAQVLRDRDFFEESGGGLTLTGGEPLAQPEFAKELARLSKEAGITVCVETSGFCPPEVLGEIAGDVDLFLYDWKITDDGLHRQYTGQSNIQIRENLALLNRLGARVELRCPIIPGINDDPGHLAGIGELTREFPCICAVTLEGYHPLGCGKAEQVGMEPFPLKTAMEQGRLEKLAAQLKPLSAVPVQFH